MTERDQQTAAGVPRLIDQYKQRREAWLAQADELVRLRDQVRSAAEREAIEIVTAARRDVRRVVVEARRNLLVLTAQLHAAIDSVDQASLQAASDAALAADAHSQAAADVLSGQTALGATHDAVLVARREVRSVLDEARAEIEALVAEANGPLRDHSTVPMPAPAASAGRAEPPIPTLDTILAGETLAHRGASVAPPAAPEPTPAIDVVSASGFDDHDDDQRPPVVWHQESESRTASSGPGSTLTLSPTTIAPPPPSVDEALSFIVTTPDPPSRFTGFRGAEEPVPEPLSNFAETGPVQFTQVTEPGRGFLAEYEDGPRSRPAWMWVGLFAATGIVAIVGTVWWFAFRDSGTALATSIERTETAPAAAVSPATATTPAVASAASGPSGLAIEVRRTAWIRTVIDGKEDSRVYQAGETRQIVGARAVSIRAGDGGAVFVAVDGRPAEALGAPGRAVTKQYSLAGGGPAPTPVVATAPAVEPPAVEPLAAGASTVVPARLDDPVPPAGQPGRSPDTARATTPANPPAAATAAPAPVPVGAPPAAETPAAAPPAGGGRADLIAAGQQWLDAYQRRDRDAMSASGTENMTISDERSVTERFPAWQTGVRRDLDQLELELSGDTALLTARMTERSGEAGSTSAQHVSRVSQIWVRRSGRWRLADVRIIGEARLNQIVR